MIEGKKNITNEIRFYPLLVSEAGLEPQSSSESERVWEQLDHIHENNRRILLGAEIIESLFNAEKFFGWEPYYTARLSYFIRELFFHNISQSEFYKAVEGLFASRYQARINEILSYINNKILTSQPDPEEVEEEESAEEVILSDSIKKYTLLDAMSRYPAISNQFITKENIKLKGQVSLVRPTLSNWLKSYRDEIGIGKHDAVTRAHFLFESLNTEKLTSEERERLHMIVRSLEDNELLDIDTQTQEIYFPSQKTVAAEEKRGGSQPAVSQDSEPTPDIFERFQNLPAYRDELKNVGTQKFSAEEAKKQGGVLASGKEESAEAVLSHIKNMKVTPGPIHAPAPQEDFNKDAPAPQGVPQPKESQEYLGTLRFSAKHILPAEKQHRRENVLPEALSVSSKFAKPSSTLPPLKEKQSPQQTPVPAKPLSSPQPPAQKVSPPLPPKPAPVFVPQNPPAPPKPEVRPKDTQPVSIFRIKPNKDELI